LAHPLQPRQPRLSSALFPSMRRLTLSSPTSSLVYKLRPPSVSPHVPAATPY
jgi:hypothetical protein